MAENTETPKTTMGKAWVAGVATMVAVIAALAGIGDMPTDLEIQGAINDILEAVLAAAGAGASVGLLTWLKRNHPKKG